VRTVDLGPFKHGDRQTGWSFGKAAFDCMDTLLATCFHRIQASHLRHALPPRGPLRYAPCSPTSPHPARVCKQLPVCQYC